MELSALTNTAADYLGLKKHAKSKTASVLLDIVKQHSFEIFFSEDKLKYLLRSSGVCETEIVRLILMTNVTGFRQLVMPDFDTSQTDIDCYLANALEETGLTRFAVLELTAAIALSVNKGAVPETISESGDPNKKPFVIPTSFYETDMAEFDRKSAYGTLTYTSVPYQQRAKLQYLADAGVPKANRYLGRYMLINSESFTDPSSALDRLNYAVNCCDSEAAAILGDYYYQLGTPDALSKAYEYYTGYGSLALIRSRKNAVLSIVETGKTNRKVLILSFVMAVLMTFLLFFSPGKELFDAHTAVGIGCMVLIFVAFAAAILRYRKKPYDSFTWLPVSISILWFVYQAIRIIF